MSLLLLPNKRLQNVKLYPNDVIVYPDLKNEFVLGCLILDDNFHSFNFSIYDHGEYHIKNVIDAIRWKEGVIKKIICILKIVDYYIMSLYC